MPLIFFFFFSATTYFIFDQSSLQLGVVMSHTAPADTPIFKALRSLWGVYDLSACQQLTCHTYLNRYADPALTY